MILLDVVNHSLEAEWTSELRQGALTFDVHTAVRVEPELSDGNKQHIRWSATFIWLDFILWAEQHVCIFLQPQVHIY